MFANPRTSNSHAGARSGRVSGRVVSWKNGPAKLGIPQRDGPHLIHSNPPSELAWRGGKRAADRGSVMERGAERCLELNPPFCPCFWSRGLEADQPRVPVVAIRIFSNAAREPNSGVKLVVRGTSHKDLTVPFDGCRAIGVSLEDGCADRRPVKMRILAQEPLVVWSRV